jgi:SEC-C motif
MGRKGKIGRNQPCPCGSGKKYKKCHGVIVNSPFEESAAPLVHAPEPMSFEELQQEINRLKGMLSRYDLLSLLSSCFTKLSQIDWEHPEKAGMTSPYKQCTYIASLALATPQAGQTHRLDKKNWNAICAQSEKIFAYYGLMYFRPETILAAQQSEEKHVKTGAAMVAFLYSLGTGVFASVEQMREDIHVLYGPFDTDIKSKTGLDIQEFTDISDYIIGALDRRLKEGPETLMKSWLTFRQRCDEGVDPKAALAEAKRNLEPHAFSQFALVGQVTLPELQSAFPAEKIDSIYRSCRKKGLLHPLISLSPPSSTPSSKGPWCCCDLTPIICSRETFCSCPSCGGWSRFWRATRLLTSVPTGTKGKSWKVAH